MDEQQAISTSYNGTVAVWFTTHYQTDPRDWRNIEEFHGQYHPLAGYYKSEDPQVLRQQLHDMRRAGIDAIVYDCYGTAQWTLADLPNDRALALLCDELSHQEEEARKLQLIIWLEKYFINPPLAEYRDALRYVRENLAERGFYYRYGGRPLVVTYHNGTNEAIDEIEWENDYFTLRRIRPYHSDVWSYVEHYPQRLNREWMVASPGSDPYLELAYLAKYYHKDPQPDYEKIRQDSLKSADDREGGEYFKKQLLRARYGNPNIIFISGWNDWQYANHIEPAVEYGYQYVDMAARLLGRAAETASYRD
jgi:hypothetical protein